MQQDRDFVEKLTVKLDNKHPVEVTDFLKSINAFQKEYKQICKEEGVKYEKEDIKLYIKVREGSVQWEFIRQVVTNPYLFPVTSVVRTMSLYLIKKTADVLIEKVIDGKKPETQDTKTLRNAKDFLSVQKNDIGSNMSFGYQNSNDNKTNNFNNCYFYGVNSRGVMDFIEDEIKDKNEINVNNFGNEVLELTFTNENKIKGKIAEITEEPKVLIFKNNLRSQIITDNEQNPLSIIYIVNGKIKKAGEKIVAYEITELVEIIKDNDSTTP